MKETPRQSIKFVCGICMILIVSQFAGVAQTWSPADQFSATNNPSTVWQYGYQTNLGDVFVSYDMPTSIGTGLNYWVASNTGNYNPNVSFNPSSNSVAAFDFVLLPHHTAFHPGPNGQYSIYRWTAPSTGTFAIHADFVGLATQSGSDVHVLVNGVSIFSGALTGQDTTTAFDGTNYLAAGNLVDFAVGYGISHSYFSDTTGINATITALKQPLPLNIQIIGSNVILSWTNSAFLLQASSRVGGPFTNIPAATSPNTNAMTDLQRYFRLISN